MYGRVLSPMASLSFALVVTACHTSVEAPTPERTSVEHLLAPNELAAALIASGGGKLAGRTHFYVAPSGDAAGLQGAQDIVTTTEVRLDKAGHFSLHEENNHDGGREIYFDGQDLAVKLKYGKLIRRTARAPEPRELLEQGLGGPWAAWQVLSGRAKVAPGPPSAEGNALLLTLAPAVTQGVAGGKAAEGALSSWRTTAVPSAVSGKIVFQPAVGTLPARLVAAQITGAFSAKVVKNGKAHDLEGRVEVTFQTAPAGDSVAGAIPSGAEAAWTRQRTILEERALLGNAPAK